ncbi:MAG TPA: hypothetical protein VEB40_08580 [Flavipsychrobacter sp.]|nr:hypothetical protein [Flavipsychrobacter sp.]
MKKIALILMGLAFMASSCSREIGRGVPKTTVYEPLRKSYRSGGEKIKVIPMPRMKESRRSGSVIKYDRK